MLGNKIFLSVSDVVSHIYVQVATAQIATTGMVALSYVQKVSEKASFFHIIFNTYIFLL